MNITVKSYDGKMVSIPEENREEYLRNQKRIKEMIKAGKTKEEIMEVLKGEWRREE